ncbi:hypothetical protein CHELA1G11_13053 [Hyphomicrobiales bacterium]|nr:hypothetical protein CHELA1G2_11256 [Hyphomicrobiales bacterium]CAH1668974.1 hypothetical protein CHELA1G11_13053 [Hyphomicrobiales bacterium]
MARKTDRSISRPLASDWSDFELMTLREACEVFLGGLLEPRSLRTEVRKGTLTLTRVAGKDFVTPSAIKEMLRLCRSDQKDHASMNAPHAATSRGKSPTRASGSSEMDRLRLAQAAARMTSLALKERSLPT